MTWRAISGESPFGFATLLKPDGSTQTSAPFWSGNTDLPTQTLPVSGTYTIVIDPANTNTGSLTVAVTSP